MPLAHTVTAGAEMSSDSVPVPVPPAFAEDSATEKLPVWVGVPAMRPVVGLTPIQQTLGADRSVVALAGSLTWIGTGLGGILMGWMANRIGIRAATSIGGVMTAAGLAVAANGTIWGLCVGHGRLIGLLGNGALYAPLLVDVSS